MALWYVVVFAIATLAFERWLAFAHADLSPAQRSAAVMGFLALGTFLTWGLRRWMVG